MIEFIKHEEAQSTVANINTMLEKLDRRERENVLSVDAIIDEIEGVISNYNRNHNYNIDNYMDDVDEAMTELNELNEKLMLKSKLCDDTIIMHKVLCWDNIELVAYCERLKDELESEKAHAVADSVIIDTHQNNEAREILALREQVAQLQEKINILQNEQEKHDAELTSSFIKSSEAVRQYLEIKKSEAVQSNDFLKAHAVQQVLNII